MVNISEEDGRFTANGQHTAALVNSKKVYVYDYQGNYLTSYSSIKECSQQTGIYISTIQKCLRGQYKYAKKKQFSFEHKESLEDLTNYSTGSSTTVKVTDGQQVLTFKSILACKEYFNLEYKSTGIKYLLGALNKKYGNKYKV